MPTPSISAPPCSPSSAYQSSTSHRSASAPRWRTSAVCLAPAVPDLIVTHFVLDCLTQPELDALVAHLTHLIAPALRALWLISDFRIPSGLTGHFPALALHPLSLSRLPPAHRPPRHPAARPRQSSSPRRSHLHRHTSFHLRSPHHGTLAESEATNNFQREHPHPAPLRIPECDSFCSAPASSLPSALKAKPASPPTLPTEPHSPPASSPTTSSPGSTPAKRPSTPKKPSPIRTSPANPSPPFPSISTSTPSAPNPASPRRPTLKAASATRSLKPPTPAKKRGSITIANISADGFGDLTPLLHFTAPDDNNQNDHTVAELTLPHPIAPNDSITFHLIFHDQFPESIARNGYKRDFLMGGQWYPKLGVFWHGAMELPPIPLLHRVLLRLRHLPRSPHPSPPLHRRGLRRPHRPAVQPRWHPDPYLLRRRHPRLRLGRQPPLHHHRRHLPLIPRSRQSPRFSLGSPPQSRRPLP